MGKNKVSNDYCEKDLNMVIADYSGKHLDREVFARAGNGIRGFGHALSEVALVEQACGVKLIGSEFFTNEMEILVRRSWKERLWSWPWKPWVAEKSKVEHVPDPKLYQAGKMIMGHPTAIAKLARELLGEGCN